MRECKNIAGCQQPLRCANLARCPLATSAGTPPEPVAAPLVGAGELVLLRRSAAEDIIRHWSEQATYFRRLAAGYRNCGDTRGAAVAADTATIYERHSAKIQRLLDAAILRQLQENTKITNFGANKSP